MRDLPAGPAGGAADASRLRVALVVSGYHEVVTGPLRDGAAAALARVGVDGDRVVVISAPGAFEIPFVAREAAATGAFDAVVCLGCVIRGETPHFDYIASAVAHGITAASQATRVPMTFGVLTTNSRDEALARAGPDETNKGWEAAMAAVRLAAVSERLGRLRGTGSDE